jgi:opacity protein-like surface antigen
MTDLYRSAMNIVVGSCVVVIIGMPREQSHDSGKRKEKHKMKKTVISAVIPLMFVFGTDTTLAGARVGNHSNPYAGVALQQSTGDFGTGFKIYGGYEFMDFDMGTKLVYVSGEVAYHDFGEDGPASATGLSATAVARMAVQKKLDVFARAGLAQTTVDVEVCVLNVCNTASETKVGITIGGGARYDITDQFVVFAGADIYSMDTGTEPVLSLGGEFRF